MIENRKETKRVTKKQTVAETTVAKSCELTVKYFPKSLNFHEIQYFQDISSRITKIPNKIFSQHVVLFFFVILFHNELLLP